MEFLGSRTSPICSKQLQMAPDIPILCNRCVSQSILLSEEKNLWNQLYSWDFLSLELNFSLLSKLISARLPNFAQTPTFGLKIAYLFACLGRRLLPTVRIGSTADHPTPMQVFNFWTKFDYGFLFCVTIAQRCPLWWVTVMPRRRNISTFCPQHGDHLTITTAAHSLFVFGHPE